MLLKGKRIALRALEPEDLTFLFEMENDEHIWQVSNTQAPFSKYVLKNYIEQSHQDIYQAKQLRLIIEEQSSKKTLGMIDLFDFEPQHKRAGIGIVIHPSQYKRGFASEALEMIISYSFDHLGLHQLYANISSNNEASIALFEKYLFKKIGVKKDWTFYNKTFNDEILYQRIHE